MTAQSLTEMRRLLTKHGVSPRKSLGQHFLADPNLTRKVVAAADVQAGDRVLEIGAGTGTLTRALTEAGARVLAVEVDPRLAPILEETLAGMDVDLRIVDARHLAFESELIGGPWKMVANLPYEVGTGLLLDILRKVPIIHSFTVMVQLEVARRLVAKPGSADYGLPSVIIGLHGEASRLFNVPPQVFYPPPRVDSAVVGIRRQVRPGPVDRAIDLAVAGFGQRRKMLRSSLRSMLIDPTAVLLSVGIDPSRRAESLSPDEFLHMAEAAP
ncbi:MAG: 16S rRNA (adenine(1518)-N(6)/adenine(1519)-N(6))-dimethyltransferase RsmA [Acidimicrobiia bacterium]